MLRSAMISALTAFSLFACEGKDEAVEPPSAPCFMENDYLETETDIACTCNNYTSTADLNAAFFRSVETCGPDDFPRDALCCAEQSLDGTVSCRCSQVRCAVDYGCACGTTVPGVTVESCAPADDGEVCCQSTSDGSCDCRRRSQSDCTPGDEVEVSVCSADQVEPSCQTPATGLVEVDSCNLQDYTPG